MPAKYHQVIGDEKPIHTLHNRESTESLKSTLLNWEYDEKSQDVESMSLRRLRCNDRWIWLVHAVLLSLSFGLFISTYFTRMTTLKYVEEYSAWCESTFSSYGKLED